MCSRSQFASVVGDENVLRAPEEGCYQGPTATGHPLPERQGIIALTDERLLFIMLRGKLIEIPLETITALRHGPTVNNSPVTDANLIVRTRSGEVGFSVADSGAWIRAIAKACQ